MCGFFGFVDLNEQASDRDVNEVVLGASRIKHRGPDDDGFSRQGGFCAAFRRLSIIDLSAPSQPYQNESGSLTMLCNGEIYNHKELRQQLEARGYRFHTHTDVEVVLHGYEEWGDGLWPKMNGIFAAVVWDNKKKKLTLVRDHMGVKPIHYMVVGSRLYFGSDYNSFFEQTRQSLSFNPGALLSYLSFRYVIGEQTFYREIKDVLSGHRVCFSTAGLNNHAYWDIPVDVEENWSEESCLEMLDGAMSKAVNRQLMSDVPLGAFISGGLDSSILLHYMHQNKKDIRSYITGFDVEGYNEFYYADLMADSLGIKPKKLTLSPDEYMSDMEEVIALRGEPASVPHEAAFLRMARFMKKDISVVLSGEGADELFGGYGRIFRSPLDYYKGVRRGNPDYETPMDHFLARYSWFGEQDKKELLSEDVLKNGYFDDYSMEYVSGLFDRSQDNNYYKTMYYLQAKIHLPNLLNRLDRMTMGASVEARVPFLDVELVELVSRMPLQYKLRWKSCSDMFKAVRRETSETISEKYDIPKYILKQLAVGKVPEEIIWRKKMGFPVPLDRWFNSGMKEMARDLLLGQDSRIKEFINEAGVAQLLNRDTLTSSYDYQGKRIWMLMNIELWIRKYF